MLNRRDDASIPVLSAMARDLMGSYLELFGKLMSNFCSDTAALRLHFHWALVSDVRGAVGSEVAIGQSSDGACDRGRSTRGVCPEPA